MKKTIHTIFAVGIAACLTGCASTKAYLADRGRDALDMINAGVEIGSVGVSAQAGPVMTGAIFTEPEKKSNGWGLVNRGLGCYEYGDWQAIIIGYKASGSKATRGRECGTRQIACFADGTELFGWNCPPCYYALGKIEARAGLGVGLHIGLHLGEIADFFLGWFGADLMSDDKKQESNQEMHRTK